MTRKDYTQEFKEQILRESQEVGNVSLVARRLDCTGFAGHVEKTYNEAKGRVRNYEREQFSQKV